MFCPHDVNTGFIQLVGPIKQQELNSIAVKSYPLSISFAPRTTPPTLIGNRIDESTENTCTYRGKRFTLVDVQICSPTSLGYTLPGMTQSPVAELILSFSANGGASDLAQLSGILMCVPIYDSGNPSHSAYLNQIVDPNFPACKYTTVIGSDYVGGDYQQIPNSSLVNCIRSCCNDPNCLAYTFNGGTCYLKNSIPPLTNTGNNSIVTGTVNHTALNTAASNCPVPNCPIPKCNGKHKGKNNKTDETLAFLPNLETIFYEFDGDTTQTSFAYKTCFETMDENKNPTSRSLYVVVFPNGIHLMPAIYQQLLIQLNGTLTSYMIPPAMRSGENTLRSFTFDEDGNKVPKIISRDGIIYATPLSSCTDEFINRFEYFTVPPRLSSSSSNSARLGNGTTSDESCPNFTTKQYKCMPFDQLRDLSGNMVIPGNKTLETILAEQQMAKQQQTEGSVAVNGGMTTDAIETVVASVAGFLIVGMCLLPLANYISKKL